VPKRPVVWLNAVFLIATPLLALVLVPWSIATFGLGWQEVLAAVVLWWGTGLGITAGYHRLFSHRTYKASSPVRWMWALLGGAAWQNSVITWCAGHRYHHRDVDTDGDPYSIQQGFFYAHMGWVMIQGPRHDALDNVQDLWDDPVCRFQHEHYLALSTAFNLGVPLLLGLAVGRVWPMLIVAGLLRVVLVHHFTFFINSAAHTWGTQPWSTRDSSRDSWLLSLLTFGEGFHNYHHTFQTDYRNGPRWYHWDPSKWTIWGLSRLGQAADLRRMPDDVVLRRRFQHQRMVLLDRIGETFEDWRERLVEQTHGVIAGRDALAQAMTERSEALQDGMRQRVLDAEARMETALSDLKDARQRWAAAHSLRFELPPEHRAQLEAELRELKRTFRAARASVRASVRHWEALCQEYLVLYEVVPA